MSNGNNMGEKEACREITRSTCSAKAHCSCFRRRAGVSQGRLLKKRKRCVTQKVLYPQMAKDEMSVPARSQFPFDLGTIRERY